MGDGRTDPAGRGRPDRDGLLDEPAPAGTPGRDAPGGRRRRGGSPPAPGDGAAAPGRAGPPGPDAGKGGPGPAPRPGPGTEAGGTAFTVWEGLLGAPEGPGMVLLGRDPAGRPWAWRPRPASPAFPASRLLVAGLDGDGEPWVAGWPAGAGGGAEGPVSLSRRGRWATFSFPGHRPPGPVPTPLGPAGGPPAAGGPPIPGRPSPDPGRAADGPRGGTPLLWAGWGPACGPAPAERPAGDLEDHPPVPWIVVHRPAQGAEPGNLEVWIGPGAGAPGFGGWLRLRPLWGERIRWAAACGDPAGRAVFVPWYRLGPVPGAGHGGGEWRVLWFDGRWRDEPVILDTGDGTGAAASAEAAPPPAPGQPARGPILAAGWCHRGQPLVVLAAAAEDAAGFAGDGAARVAGPPAPRAAGDVAERASGDGDAGAPCRPQPRALRLGLWRRHETGHWRARWFHLPLEPEDGPLPGAAPPAAAGSAPPRGRPGPRSLPADGSPPPAAPLPAAAAGPANRDRASALLLRMEVDESGGLTLRLRPPDNPGAGRVLARITAGGQLEPAGEGAGLPTRAFGARDAGPPSGARDAGPPARASGAGDAGPPAGAPPGERPPDRPPPGRPQPPAVGHPARPQRPRPPGPTGGFFHPGRILPPEAGSRRSGS
ncbi:hypothetical protein [Thermaerobacter litoralis]